MKTVLSRLTQGSQVYPEIKNSSSSTHSIDLYQDKVRKVHFEEKVQLAYTHSRLDYDRRPQLVVPLTERMADLIRTELNVVKQEMEIHAESHHFTHFYRVSSTI